MPVIVLELAIEHASALLRPEAQRYGERVDATLLQALLQRSDHLRAMVAGRAVYDQRRAVGGERLARRDLEVPGHLEP